MPPIIYEDSQSRKFTSSGKTASLTRKYNVRGTSDETEVYELAGNFSPILYDGLVRASLDADPKGGGVWTVDVLYSPIDPQQAEAGGATEPQPPTSPGPNDPLGGSVSFETSGGTANIKQSKGTRSVTTRTGAGNDTGTQANNYTLTNQRAIGLTKDGVAGCDIQVPGLQFQIEVLRANCTDEYINTLSALTGTVNYGAAWRNRAAGTTLYLGASGRFTQKDRWTITHKFAYQPNVLNLRISEDIVVPEKKGWDYIWVSYKEEVNAVLGQVVNVPDAAFVEYVYDNGDFAQLEIGD